MQEAHQQYLKKEFARITTVIPWSEYKGDHVFFDDNFIYLDEIDDNFCYYTDTPIGWAHAVRYEREFPSLDASALLYNHYESHELSEDTVDNLTASADVAGLQKALDDWTRAQSYEVWRQDESVAVVFALSEEAMWEAVRRSKSA